MAGHLDEFWPDIADSAWRGGQGEGWERVPYWLDGIVPLAALVGDARLVDKVHAWVDAILRHRRPDGWVGPVTPDPSRFHEGRGPYDVWPRMPLLKALLQYYDAFQQEHVLTAAVALSRKIDDVLAQWPLHEWGRARWADLVWCCDRLYELTGDACLLSLADRARDQGYDWLGYARKVPYQGKIADRELQQFRADSDGMWMNDRYLDSHGVNVAMGLKAVAVRPPRGDGETGPELFQRFLAQLDRFHGQATGLFTADEHLAGRHPSQGTETCTVVEYLFSLATALETWGPSAPITQRWERIAYNALPASSRPNDWGHQYDQQANQVICHVTDDRIYTNNGPDSNVFALAPHFGCCTANRHQGWPKFASRLWMRHDNGLTALTYAPCRINTDIAGAAVAVEVAGCYPFDGRVPITVTCDGPSAEFELSLLIPRWAAEATVSIDEDLPFSVTPGEVAVLRRDWRGSHRIMLTIPMLPTAELRTNGAATISHGPLVMSVSIDEDWKQIGGDEPYGTWEVHPASPWNVSLELDPANPGESLSHTGPPSFLWHPFSRPEGSIALLGHARIVPGWRLEHGAAAEPPPSPTSSNGARIPVRLVPYGAARLRVTEVPWHTPSPRNDEPARQPR